ncbi:MAG: ABC-F family ATP-binding cassette domain-containing protein [Oscillochloridaceae bacterium umkhey_bin13]
MLQVHGLRKAYGAATILHDISFTLNPGEHVGLIGPNGAGKSTLLRIITGRETPDAGQIIRAPHLQLGYLAQDFADQPEASVGTILSAAQAELSAAATVLEQATLDLAAANADELDAAMAQYAAAEATYEALGGYARAHRAAAILAGLGLSQVEPATPLSSLSGGQCTRLGLASLLLSEPNLLLLDEPTNHLDHSALAWLENFLATYPYAALIVSHDRRLLDQCVSRVLVLDPATGTLRSYVGGYSAYAEARAQEQTKQAAAWNDQQQYIGEVRRDIAQLRGASASQAATRTPVGNHDLKWITGSSQKLAAKQARQAKARERKLERYLAADERVERPRQSWAMKLDFGTPPPAGRAVLSMSRVQFAYPGGSELFGSLDLELWHGERVALVGPNGSGKSTLLRLIAGELPPQAGQIRIGAGVQLGVLGQHHELLDPQRSLLDHVLHTRLMEEGSARSFLHMFLFGGDSVFRPIAACSLGERSRLQLALLVLQGCNLLLLDEPLNHLDLAAREQFEQALDAFDGTVLVVSHDRALSWERGRPVRMRITAGGTPALPGLPAGSCNARLRQGMGADAPPPYPVLRAVWGGGAPTAPQKKRVQRPW